MLARTTLKRFLGIGVGAVTQQEIDDRVTAAATAEKAVDAAQATVNANQADVDRLQQLTGFERVYAPFEGIITARNVDPGSRRPSSSASRRSIRFASSCTCRRRTHSTCASASPPMSRCVNSPIGSSREP